MAPDDLVPWSDARQGRIDEDEPVHAVRIFGGKGIADHVADVMGHQVGFIDLERVEHSDDIVTLRLLVVSSARPRRKTHRFPRVATFNP